MAKMLAMPENIERKYRHYCAVTNIKETTHLRILVLKRIPALHDAATLNEIVERTQKSDPMINYVNIRLFLPEETIKELDKYSAFFKLGRKKCKFLYFLIEEDLQKAMEGI